MEYQFNIKSKRDIKKLNNSKRFIKYPDMFLSNTCSVRINGDEFLNAEEFVIRSKHKVLPRKLCVFGKKNTGYKRNDNDIYLNYWLDIFLKTVEEGNLCKYDFKRVQSKLELSIGLPLEFRRNAFKCRYWSRENIISFLSCLFDIDIEEESYEQQDLLENLLVA